MKLNSHFYFNILLIKLRALQTPKKIREIHTLTNNVHTNLKKHTDLHTN